MDAPRSTSTFGPDDFKVLELSRDRDALALIAIAVALVIGSLAALAFLPDEAWHRLEDRAPLAYAALLGLVPAILAFRDRFRVRREGARALGVTAAAVAPEIARNELYGMHGA